MKILKNVKLYLLALINPEYVLSSLKVTLVVGTLLLIINHGAAFLNREMTAQRWNSACLSYIVPHLVSTYGKFSVQHWRLVC